MRSLNHWSPHYIASRLAERYYRISHPDEPWLTPQAIRFLEGWLKTSDSVLEYGSGRSTLWLARRVGQLVSVEHDPRWHDRVASAIQTQRLQNITYHLKSIEGRPSEYASVITQCDGKSLDVVLVDGKLRDECANSCLPKLKPGGLLVVDNADVYLPSQLRTPNAHQTGVSSQGWQTFLDATIHCRFYWTCNGVSATAFFFMPNEL